METFFDWYLSLFFISIPLTFVLLGYSYRMFRELCWTIFLSKDDKDLYKGIIKKMDQLSNNEDGKMLRRYKIQIKD